LREMGEWISLCAGIDLFPHFLIQFPQSREVWKHVRSEDKLLPSNVLGVGGALRMGLARGLHLPGTAMRRESQFNNIHRRRES
jgi:hypothetical protein